MDFTVAKFLHVLSAALAFGGVAFTLFAWLPSLRKIDPALAAELGERVTHRFRWVIYAAIALLLITGIWMVFLILTTAAPRPLFHAVLGVKIVLALAVFGIALLLVHPVRGLESMREHRNRWLVVNFHLAIVVFFLGIWLGRI